jgi:ubiquinone/menaquinone biosynthesis C-methylase UbiE
MKRMPEPELMDDPQHVDTYTGPYLDNGYWLFIQSFRRFFPDLVPSCAILDLGCGPASIPLRLAKLFPHCEIHGVDGAPHMLAAAREAVQRDCLEDRVRLFHGILPDDLSLDRERYEIIISNSFLHHLTDPMVLWNTIRKYSSPHAAVLVIDLLRPTSKKSAQAVVDTYVPDAPPMLRQDMLLSLYAAYTLDEISAQLAQANLTEHLTLTMASPCQFTAYGYLP